MGVGRDKRWQLPGHGLLRSTLRYGSAAGKRFTARPLAGLGLRHDNERVRPRSPLMVTFAGVLAASFVLAACSPPEYRYVRDTSTRTAFRVPTAWTIYDEATVLGEIQGQQGD